eukprot:1158979-Pelagomonas_calceolata.AAC.4
MGSVSLWLAFISQFEYPIRILAAVAVPNAPAAAAAAVPDADAWKLCCWTVAAGGDWRSSVQEWSHTSNPKLSTSCHAVLNTHWS